MENIRDQAFYDRFFAYSPTLWLCIAEVSIATFIFSNHRFYSAPFTYMLYLLPLFALMPWLVSKQGSSIVKKMSNTEISPEVRRSLLRKFADGADLAYVILMLTLSVVSLSTKQF